MVFIRNLVGGLLAELEDDINHDKFKRLLHYSRRLVAFKNRAKLVRFYFFCHHGNLFFIHISGPRGPGRSTRTRLALQLL
jgi:hypothetical protein